MHEAPHCSVIYLQTAIKQFTNKALQGKVALFAALNQPTAVLADDLFGSWPPILTRRCTIGLAQAPDPIDHRAEPNTKLLCGLSAGMCLNLSSSNNPFTKIHRIWFAHARQPPCPESLMDQKLTDLGIP
jgi:hypothetical protein